MTSPNGTECLLVSRNSEFLRRMTASLAQVGMPTTICSQDERVLELAGEGNYVVVVIDLQTIPTASELVSCVRSLERQSMLVGVAGRLNATEHPLVQQMDLVLNQPVSAARVKKSLKQLFEARARCNSKSMAGFSHVRPDSPAG